MPIVDAVDRDEDAPLTVVDAPPDLDVEEEEPLVCAKAFRAQESDIRASVLIVK